MMTNEIEDNILTVLHDFNNKNKDKYMSRVQVQGKLQLNYETLDIHVKELKKNDRVELNPANKGTTISLRITPQGIKYLKEVIEQ